MEPEEALHWHILRRKKDGVEAQIDLAVEKLGAVPTLNTVLLPAMKEVGDKFGAGELILPFVLQSAEVMKKAVAQLEQYLDKLEGYTKGTVVLATVFGDVHDIGKSLVNTILTNNGYTVVDLGKQVPIGTILEAAEEHKATAIGLSALLVSTSKQMPLAVRELHERGLEYPVLVGGAAINRDFGRRILYPKGLESDEVYDPGVFYCKDAFAGLAVMDQLVEPERRTELVAKARDEAQTLREKGPEPELGPTDDESVRSTARTDVPVPKPPFLGVREIPVDLDEVFPHLDTHVLFKLHWGGRGQKGEDWRRLVEDDFQPRLERMWAEQDYLRPRALLGLFPCNAVGNSLEIYDPEDPERVLETLVFPRQPAHDRICITDFYRPKESGERDVVAIQAVTAGPQVTDLMADLEQRGEFAEQLFTHGLGVQTAEGMAEWLHAKVRADLGIAPDQGRRWSWGYPACPDQAEHTKVFRLLGADVDRPVALRRPRRRARAVHGRDRRPPPAGGLLRHEVRLHPEAEDARRGHQGHREGPEPRRRGRLAARAASVRRMKILAVDGGGIRGLIPALVLAEIERRSGRPVGELVDLVAGTSTGGIIACALTRPDPLPAIEVAAIYEEEGPKIFDRSLLKRIRSVDGLLDERYDSAGLVAALETYLGSVRLADADPPVLLTAYDIERRRAVLLRTGESDVSMVDAAHASSAAPTYFEPVAVDGAALIDGGVFATNPAVFAYAQAGGELELLASLGTGEQTRPLPLAEVRGWGQLEWVRPLIDVVFDGSADAVDLQLGALLGADYVRLQTPLDEASDALDDASPENLAALRREAERLIAARDDEIDRLCARLAA